MVFAFLDELDHLKASKYNKCNFFSLMPSFTKNDEEHSDQAHISMGRKNEKVGPKKSLQIGTTSLGMYTFDLVGFC